jgi:hypothetical protein
MLRWLHNFTVTLAWFFLLASLCPLAVMLVTTKGWVGSETATIFQTTTNDRTFTAWGLQYHGVLGSLVLWMQFLGVGLALWMSTLSHVLLRRAALMVILAWALLMLGNAWWLRIVARWDMLPYAAAVVSVGFICTAYLVAIRWRSSPRQAIEIDVSAGQYHAHALN